MPRPFVFSLILVLFCLCPLVRSESQPEKDQKKYFSSTSFSALLTSGNSKDFSFSLDTDQNLSLNKHKINLRGKIIYAQSSGEKKSEIYASALEYNYQLNPRIYLLALSNFDRNVLSGYNFRFAFSVGTGLTWLERKKVHISTEASLGWSTENNAEGLAQQMSLSSSFVSSTLSTKLIYQISSSAEFILQETLFLDLRSFQGYRLNSYSSLSASINRYFALKTSIQVNYENRPVPGFKNTDLFFLSSIVLKI
jgi:putative salt-induced outer membrane protein YdiY